ncbi:hypothetical protein [Acholeplasma hippikon]|nr:hypothetical protein [Acholeplasma hippikon]
MKKNIFADLNIDRVYKNEFKKLNDKDFIVWINEIFGPYDFSSYSKLKDEILNHFDKNLNEYIMQIDELLKHEIKYEKYFLQALKELILSQKNKENIFKSLDLLTKYVYKYTKSLDEMIAEKLRHYKLLIK